MKFVIFSALVMMILPLTHVSLPATIVGNTGDPVLYDSGKGAFPVMNVLTEPAYQKLLADMQAKKTDVVPIKRKPDGLSSDAKFGFMMIDGREVSWALQGDDTVGFTMYVDSNANGDLSDDPPLPFEKHDGKYSVVIKTSGKATENGKTVTYPVVCKYQLYLQSAPGQQQKAIGLVAMNVMLRRGTIQVGGHDIAFGLLGRSGIYNKNTDVIVFDLNNDGQLDIDTPLSSESYKISEKFVNIGNATYEFEVDPYGRSVTLKPLPEAMAPRPMLTPGNKAPDIDYVDLEGKSHKLSDYRGKVVVIDFWGAWCAPCVRETPSLVESYNKYHGKGFEIIGIDAADKDETLKKFIADKNMAWVQTREEQNGRLHKLFRIDIWPSHFLIDAEGSIVMFSNSWSQIQSRLDELMEKRK